MSFKENLKKLLESGQILEGLWISPLGEIRVAQEHGPDLKKDPEFFGFSKRDVQGARLEDLRNLAEGLIRAGWVRYRYLSGDWMFEVISVTLKIGIIEELLVQLRAYPYEKVVIEQTDPKRTYKGTVAQFYDRAMFSYYGLGKSSWRMSR